MKIRKLYETDDIHAPDSVQITLSRRELAALRIGNNLLIQKNQDDKAQPGSDTVGISRALLLSTDIKNTLNKVI